MNPPEYTQMVKALAKSGEAILSEMTPANAHLLHMALGVCGEAAEITEHLFDVAIFGVEFDKPHYIKELGDVEFYLEGLEQRQPVDTSVLLEDPSDKTFTHLPPQFVEETCVASRLQVHAGRLLDQVKKAALYCKPIDVERYSRAIMWVNYDLQLLRQERGITREECLEENQKKLVKRYGAQYSNQAAQTRADETNPEPYKALAEEWLGDAGVRLSEKLPKEDTAPL